MDIPIIDVSDIDIIDDTVKIRAIKIKESVYYGPKNVNKNKFMRMYKKLGLTWREYVEIEDKRVDGWFNEDKSQYIIKLSQEGEYKRLKFYGCDDIYDYFISLGAETFDYGKEDITNLDNSTVKDNGYGYRFIGADLWSNYRTVQLLKKAPMNWGVKWK